MQWTRMRLGQRLGVTHGVFVVLSVVLLAVMLQGLLRMLGMMGNIANERLATVDAEEELYRAAWNIEVVLRHARTHCTDGDTNEAARARINASRAAFATVSAKQTDVPIRLRTAVDRYALLAEDTVNAKDTCSFLEQPSTEARRLALDEEMTNTWIERLQELNTDIAAKETSARLIGSRTAMAGIAVAVLGAIAAVFIARITAGSVTRPIARLGNDATRLGDGDFTPLGPVEGSPEIETLRDNLERTREKLLGVDRLKQAFLASVSHELRSPLGRLREALSLLADGTVGALDAKQARVLSLARRACEQEVRIVDALLDMQRISTGLPVQREGGCDLEKVVAAAVEAERDVANDRGVEIAVDTRAVPPTLRLDSALVERAIANLIRNAVSVSPRASTVRVVVDVIEDPRRARIDVVDQGPGVTDAVASRIFEPFNAGQVKDRPGGIGLGLALAREVARAHGGDLGLSRAEDLTTFRFELPLGGKASDS